MRAVLQKADMDVLWLVPRPALQAFIVGRE